MRTGREASALAAAVATAAAAAERAASEAGRAQQRSAAAAARGAAAAAERDAALARRLEAEDEMFLRAQRKEAKRYVRAAFSDTSTRAKFSVMLRSHHDACRV